MAVNLSSTYVAGPSYFFSSTADELFIFDPGYIGTGRPDTDGDGVEDLHDAFREDPTEQYDTDLDGIGNNADTDDDNDGYLDEDDAFPLSKDEWVDNDQDGIGNNADTDDDNDGHLDVNDVFPFDETEWADNDADGIGNNADEDDDNDTLPDVWEIEVGLDPFDASDAALDIDNDGLTAIEEYAHGSLPSLADTDGDGYNDDVD
ncbi:hypothetical protein ACFOEK_07580, partial [Litoribrevibacter euphylliae]